ALTAADPNDLRSAIPAGAAHDKVQAAAMGVPPRGDFMKGDHLALSGGFPTVMDLDQDKYQTLKLDSMHGIGLHWSREVRVDGEGYELRVSCHERPTDALLAFLIDGVKLGYDAGTSVNLSTFMEGLPIFYAWDGL